MNSIKEKPRYTPLEERWHCITHGFGALMSLIGIYFLFQRGVSFNDSWILAGMLVFGISLSLMFLTSTAYHWVQGIELKRQMRLLDHTAIYLLIAGSYTPFALGNLRDGHGITIFFLMWVVVFIGIIFKFSMRHRLNSFRTLDVILYATMGSAAIWFLQPIIESMPANGFYFLLAGGFFYLSGTFFYLRKTLPFNHVIWHVFVMAGAFCHYFAVLFYANVPIA